MLIVPLLRAGRPIGALSILDRRDGARVPRRRHRARGPVRGPRGQGARRHAELVHESRHDLARIAPARPAATARPPMQGAARLLAPSPILRYQQDQPSQARGGNADDVLLGRLRVVAPGREGLDEVTYRHTPRRRRTSPVRRAAMAARPAAATTGARYSASLERVVHALLLPWIGHRLPGGASGGMSAAASSALSPAVSSRPPTPADAGRRSSGPAPRRR